MPETRFLDDDIIRLYEFGKPRKVENLIATLMWGDSVRIVGRQGSQWKVEIPRRVFDEAANRYKTVVRSATLPAETRFRDGPVLKVRFVDVGQGDAAIVETPGGRVVLIDGGEAEHLRRYVNVAYSHVLARKPVHCDAIIVTHGDADHFAGLTKLVNGFRTSTSPLVTADRVFHNGLVKKTTKKQLEAFGKVRTVNGRKLVVALVDNLLQVDDRTMNTPFKGWKRALGRLRRESVGLTIKRLQYGDDQKFDFLRSEGVDISVLGPITEEVGGKPALPFLRKPGSRSLSASHTINGHSIVLKLRFGNVRFLFGADLNEESEERLLERAHSDGMSLTSEVLKVPHHGSADFSPRMLEALQPVVSVVSSGDEITAKDYIHPRAGLVGALGKYSRGTVTRPLVYVTEMVAFFERLGQIEVLRKRGEPQRIQNAYRKRAFGIVHVRTDGERVLVATHSGKDDQKESYAFHVNGRGDVEFEEKTRIV